MSALNNNNSSPDADNNTSNRNPVLEFYEKFCRETPYVTRTFVQVSVASYLVSWIVNLHYALSCIPQFVVIQHYEVYRVVTSPLVNDDLISLAFGVVCLNRSSRLLEESVGSTGLLWYIAAVFTVLTNLLFLVISWALSALSGDNSYLLLSSSGIWNVVFGVMAIECCRDTLRTRKLFLWEIPTVYYPLAIFAFICLLSGMHLSIPHGISLALGYGIGKANYLLEALNVRSHHVKALEESNAFLTSRVRLQGWIMGPAALGSSAWSNRQDDDNHQGNEDRQVRKVELGECA